MGSIQDQSIQWQTRRWNRLAIASYGMVSVSAVSSDR